MLKTAQISSKECYQEKQTWPLWPSSPWPSNQPHRWQHHTSVHYGCQGQWAPDQISCKETLGHWCDQGQHPDQTWWRPMFHWLLTMMLLPIKLGSSKLGPADQIKCKFLIIKKAYYTIPLIEYHYCWKVHKTCWVGSTKIHARWAQILLFWYLANLPAYLWSTSYWSPMRLLPNSSFFSNPSCSLISLSSFQD